MVGTLGFARFITSSSGVVARKLYAMHSTCTLPVTDPSVIREYESDARLESR
jgi:hypothetical protein